MQSAYQTAAAKAFIWAFFLLVALPTVTMANTKFGIPVKPSLSYAVIAVGLAVAAMLGRKDVAFRGARTFFFAFAILVVTGGIMYRGEFIAHGYDVPMLVDSIPSNIGYVMWPALNLVAALGLFCLANDSRYRRTIVNAAFTALVLQGLTMEADMWWPAIFGDPNGRGGGIAQNANVAAILVVVLTSLLLPTRLGEHFDSYAIPAMLLMIVSVLLSQSRAGLIAGAICLTCFGVAGLKGKMRVPSFALGAAVLAALICTVWLSPVLNTTPEQVAQRQQERLNNAAARAKAGDLAPAIVDTPITLQERFETRLFESVGVRLRAFGFFLGLAKDRPFGFGTGFTNGFQTGPHNTFLKLAVDEGILAALCLVVMLCATTVRAIRMRSPALLSISMTVWVAASLSHTVAIDPFFTPALAIGLGSVSDRRE